MCRRGTETTTLGAWRDVKLGEFARNPEGGAHFHELVVPRASPLQEVSQPSPHVNFTTLSKMAVIDSAP